MFALHRRIPKACRQPILMVFEDVHWIDPTTMELLDRIVDRVATLPDPAHTHLSLSFDRATEAIQEGVSDDEYVYDSSWLPWDTQDAPYALIRDQDEAEDRRRRQEEQRDERASRAAVGRAREAGGERPWR